MISFVAHPSVPLPIHPNGFGPDEFICIGLIALVLVLATFFFRGGEKATDDDLEKNRPKPIAKP